MGILVNKRDFLAGLKASEAKVQACFSKLVKDVCTTLHNEITHGTPVWTGDTLSNWVWSISTPSVSFRYGNPIIEATNKLPLGPEIARAGAQDAADTSFAAVSFSDPYKVFYMTNNDPTAVQLEHGVWPQAPLRQRSPEGMVAVAVRYVVERLAHGGL